MKLGADYLGGKHYKKEILKTHPQNWAAGIFLRTFGNATGFIEKMCESKKFSEIVIHLAPFDRTHKYDFKNYVSQVKKDAATMEQISKRFPSTVLMLSPFCEHNHPKVKMEPLFKELKQIAPSCLMLNSIWKGEEVPGIITEIHLENSNFKKRPSGEYTVSFDGFGGDGKGDSPDCNIMDILNHYSTARHIRIWNFRYNGKYGHKDPSGISDRKYWPSEEYLRGHNAMMKNREGSITYPGNALYKPFADDHGVGGKDNKALVITKKSVSSLKVFDSNGKVIDVMQRFMPDHADGPRYYSSKYAYQLGDLAQKNTGSRLIKIDDLPLTDADLRSNKFR